MTVGETGRTARRRGGSRGRAARLALGMLGLGALALLLSQAGRLPGPAGDAIRRNADDDRDATALFYSEVNGWPAWPDHTPDR